jgi:hypothetical protein
MYKLHSDHDNKLFIVESTIEQSRICRCDLVEERVDDEIDFDIAHGRITGYVGIAGMIQPCGSYYRYS